MKGTLKTPISYDTVYHMTLKYYVIISTKYKEKKKLSSHLLYYFDYSFVSLYPVPKNEKDEKLSGPQTDTDTQYHIKDQLWISSTYITQLPTLIYTVDPFEIKFFQI